MNVGEGAQAEIDPELAPMVPPPRMWRRVGNPDDFVRSGRFFFDYLVAKGRVTPRSARRGVRYGHRAGRGVQDQDFILARKAGDDA